MTHSELDKLIHDKVELELSRRRSRFSWKDAIYCTVIVALTLTTVLVGRVAMKVQDDLEFTKVLALRNGIRIDRWTSLVDRMEKLYPDDRY